MREIEFRGIIAPLFVVGKKSTKNIWIYGSLRSTSHEHPQIAAGDLGLWTNVKPETVGQWTGIFDIDGNRLYEGDVVEMKGYINTFITGVLIYSNQQGCYIVYREDGNSMFVMEARRFKLLGNIFDNSKLQERFGHVWRLKNP